MRNQTLVVDKETETLLSVAVLLKAGFDIKFVTGTNRDPTFGGYLVTPKDSHDLSHDLFDGQKIRMIFGEIYGLPLWSDPVRYTNGQTSPTKRITLALVSTAAALDALAQPSLPDQEACSLSLTRGATPATTRWSKSTRQGGERLAERLHVANTRTKL